ncbi:MAG: hypothetical protein V1857_00865 [archaeon]
MKSRRRHRVAVKFGGSVLRDSTGFRDSAEYLIRLLTDFKPVAVVSAPKGVTDLLTKLHNTPRRDSMRRLEEMYEQILSSIPDADIRDNAIARIREQLESLEEPSEHDEFLSRGEDHSGIMLSHMIGALGCESEYTDGYNAGIITDSNGAVRESLSMSNVRKTVHRCLVSRKHVIPVIGGFVGKDLDTGRHRLLGRNSTDITGAIVAAALNSRYEIVKDVPGIYFVEPEFGESDVVPHLSYDEAGELTWRGIEAIHPIAVKIAASHNIEIIIRNLTDPRFTSISRKSLTKHERPIAAISARRFYLITVTDQLMNTGEGRGYLAYTTGILSRSGIDIYDVATSAYVISITISPSNSLVLGRKVEEILRKGLEEHGYRPTVEGRRIGAISIVGSALKNNDRVLARLLQTFHHNNVGIVVISKSESPNVIFGVEERHLRRSINIIRDSL